MAIRRPAKLEGNSDDGPRINEGITVTKVRLIDSEGTNHGIVDIETAISMANDAMLDLVEISPNVDPPVCKVLDIGKYKYEQQKRRSTARKKQKVIEVKEIKLRPTIDAHDYGIKMRSAKKFLTEGDKVKITLRYRGREMAHTEIGSNLLDNVRADLHEIGRVEQEPSSEGRQVVMVLAPYSTIV